MNYIWSIISTEEDNEIKIVTEVMELQKGCLIRNVIVVAGDKGQNVKTETIYVEGIKLADFECRQKSTVCE